MLWEKLTANEFEDAIETSKGLCILPIGALERHGQHLAVGCDGFLAKNLAARAAEKEPCVVFPTGYWLGDIMTYHSLNIDEEHKHGGFALKPQTLLNVLMELCDEIGRNGFRKILIVNGHGGNSPLLNFLLRAQMYEKHDYAVMMTNSFTLSAQGLWDGYRATPDRFPYITEEDKKVMAHYAETGFGGGHADFSEAAICLGFDPTMVRPDKFDAESGASTHVMDYLGEIGVSTGAAWGANYPNAFDAFPPMGVSETIGKVFNELATDRLAHIFKVLKEDEKAVQLAKRVPFT